MKNKESRQRQLLKNVLEFPIDENIPDLQTSEIKKISDSGNFNLGVGPNARYLFDFTLNKFMEMDASIEKITGIPADEYITKSPFETIGELAETAHIESIARLLSKAREFLHSDSGLETNDVVCNLEHNITSRNGQKKRIIVQFFKVDEMEVDGRRLHKGRIVDITHIRQDGLPKFFLMKDNEILYTEMAEAELVIKNSEIPLSKTEIKIIQLISEGLIAKEIANHLHISISTLYTHRKHIKAKMGQDINKIINLLKEKGIIYSVGLANGLGEITDQISII